MAWDGSEVSGVEAVVDVACEVEVSGGYGFWLIDIKEGGGVLVGIPGGLLGDGAFKGVVRQEWEGECWVWGRGLEDDVKGVVRGAEGDGIAWEA